MRKAEVALTLLLGVTLVTAGFQFVDLANANPHVHDYVPFDESFTPPKISIITPTNNSVFSKVITLNISVSLPGSQVATTTYLENVVYTVDYPHDPEYVWLYMMSAEEWAQVPYKAQLNNRYFVFSENLTNVPDGNHTLVITAEGGAKYSESYNFKDERGVATLLFTVDNASPKISFLSLEQGKTHYTSDIPLELAVNEPCTGLVYSLDGKENVTLQGNTTLTGLDYAEHKITVYAQDKAGNFGVSEVHFMIEPFPFLPIAFSVVTVALVTAGLLVYLKKRNRDKSP